jgi:hypothetical protein
MRLSQTACVQKDDWVAVADDFHGQPSLAGRNLMI